MNPILVSITPISLENLLINLPVGVISKYYEGLLIKLFNILLWICLLEVNIIILRIKYFITNMIKYANWSIDNVNQKLLEVNNALEFDFIISYCAKNLKNKVFAASAIKNSINPTTNKI